MQTIPNPWAGFAGRKDLTKFILPQEQGIVQKFNSKAKEDFQIKEDIFPAPYMGEVHKAPVVILMLNSGFDPKEEVKGYYRAYKDFWMKQLQHELPLPELPLFCLDEKYCTYSDYWKVRLKELTEAGRRLLRKGSFPGRLLPNLFFRSCHIVDRSANDSFLLQYSLKPQL